MRFGGSVAPRRERRACGWLMTRLTSSRFTPGSASRQWFTLRFTCAPASTHPVSTQPRRASRVARRTSPTMCSRWRSSKSKLRWMLPCARRPRQRRRARAQQQQRRTHPQRVLDGQHRAIHQELLDGLRHRGRATELQHAGAARADAGAPRTRSRTGRTARACSRRRRAARPAHCTRQAHPAMDDAARSAPAAARRRRRTRARRTWYDTRSPSHLPLAFGRTAVLGVALAVGCARMLLRRRRRVRRASE